MQISDLKPNKRNPRKISPEKKEMLQKAIAEFGDLGGIVFNRQTKQLVGGHQRVSVLPKDSKIEIEQTYAQPTRTGTVAEGHIVIKGERFKYREVDWDLVREETANIAANQHGGSWDDVNLAAIVNELFAANVDVSLLGFDPDELAKLVGDAAAEAEMPNLADTDRAEIQQMTFLVHRDQAEQIKRAMDIAKEMGAFVDTGNENSNGNALARVCEIFVGEHGNR